MEANHLSEVFTFENYSFRVLSVAQKQESLDLVARQFASHNPLNRALFRIRPQLEQVSFQNEHLLWGLIMDECSTNQLSIIICDRSKEDEIVGVALVKDIASEQSQQAEKILSTNVFIAPVNEMVIKMVEQVQNPYRQLIEGKQLNRMVDIAGVAIKPTHTGKGLLTKMIEVCLVQSQKHNFQFAYCYVSNCKTSSSLRRQGFKKIVEVNSKQFKYLGQQTYRQIEEDQKMSSIWIKDLSCQ